MARIKNEGGLSSPASSFHTPRPKFEQIDLTEEDVEVPFHSFDGLPTERQGQIRSPIAVPIRATPQPALRPQTTTMLSPDEETGLGVVGRDVKRLVEFTEQLKRIGLSTADKLLPELVLVGDQSAGKSSLMGAIAEISLPKGQSMCTRCPTNVKTSEASVWTCSVSLRLSYNYENKKTRGQTFQNWTRRDEPVTLFFKRVQEKTELEEILRYAQLAILNPSQPHTSFLPHALPQIPAASNEVQFSPNVIAVDIAGPGLPELSFYDLPGLFQAAEDPSLDYLVQMFERLTTEYIKHENALIICAMTMQNDPGLSRTKAVITRLKADNRCIGVLTMPDRLQQRDGESAHKDYTGIFKGEIFKLPRGYFVTKQPGPNSNLGGPNYFALARQQEEDFFNSVSIWQPGGEWADFRRRCGTNTIQKVLSKEFAKHILLSIPDLKDKIYTETEEVEHQLTLLPEVPEDRVQYLVRQHLADFNSQAALLFDKESSVRDSQVEFFSQWTELCDQFQAAMEALRPGCILNTVPEIISIDDDTDDGFESPPKRRKLSSSPHGSSSPLGPSTPRHNSVARNLFGGSRVKLENRALLASKFNKSDYGPFFQDYLLLGQKSMSLNNIRQTTNRRTRTGRGEPDPQRVKEDYALSAINSWSYPLKTFLDLSFRMVRAEVLRTLDIVLRGFENTSLLRRSRMIVEEFLTKEEEAQRRIATDFYDVEKSNWFTLSKRSLALHKQEALDQLTEARVTVRVKAQLKLLKLAQAGKKDVEKHKKEIEANLGPDPFTQEMEIAASIRGYYTTAQIRFTDTVCATINGRYFARVKNGMRGLLERELGLNEGDGETICRALLEGNEQISQQRIMLLKRKKKLQEFTAALAELDRDINKGDSRDEMDLDGSTPSYHARCSTDDDDDSGTIHSLGQSSF